MADLPPGSFEPRGLDPQSADVRIIAVMGTIFATLGLSCLPFNFGAWITYGMPIQGSKTTALDVWTLFSTFAGLGLSGLLLLSSLAAYRYLWWGRDGLLLWGVCSLLYGIVGIYFWGRFLIPDLKGEYVELRGPDEVAGLIAWIIGTGYSVFVLYYLTRPSIKALFDRSLQQAVPTGH